MRVTGQEAFNVHSKDTVNESTYLLLSSLAVESLRKANIIKALAINLNLARPDKDPGSFVCLVPVPVPILTASLFDVFVWFCTCVCVCVCLLPLRCSCLQYCQCMLAFLMLWSQPGQLTDHAHSLSGRALTSCKTMLNFVVLMLC